VVRSPLRHWLLFMGRRTGPNTLRARKRGRTLPVPNPSVTPGSEVHMRGGLHKEPATGGTISIVAVID
jgi:hypothetical protein